jgi:hypothetical protein
MARPLRLELAGGLYHATYRGDGREDIYLDETAIRTGLDVRLNRLDILINGWARSKTKCNTSTVYGVAMGKHYEQLKPEERATVMLMDREGSSVRAMSRALKRSASTISREIDRIV